MLIIIIIIIIIIITIIVIIIIIIIVAVVSNANIIINCSPSSSSSSWSSSLWYKCMDLDVITYHLGIFWLFLAHPRIYEPRVSGENNQTRPRGLGERDAQTDTRKHLHLHLHTHTHTHTHKCTILTSMIVMMMNTFQAKETEWSPNFRMLAQIETTIQQACDAGV